MWMFSIAGSCKDRFTNAFGLHDHLELDDRLPATMSDCDPPRIERGCGTDRGPTRVVAVCSV